MTSNTDTPTIERLAEAGGLPMAELRRRALEMLPLLVGYAPFASIVGAAVSGSVNTAAVGARLAAMAVTVDLTPLTIIGSLP